MDTTIKPKTLWRVVSAGLLAWHISAAAEPAPAAPAAPAALDSVTLVGHYDNAPGTSDAASAGLVTASMIAARPALRTGDMLEFVPGMIVTQHSGDGKANQYFLRGFNLDHGTDFATYVDGMPLNLRSNAHGQGYADLNFVIPETVQRIDYKKGPYYADEGDFSAAGAAHIRLADTLPQGIASLTAGADGYQRGVLVDSRAALSGMLLSGLELNRNNGPWDSPEQVRKYSALLKYSRGDRQDGASFTAMAYHNDWNATDQIALRAVQQGLIGRFGTLDPSDGGATSRYSLAYAMYQRSATGSAELEAYLVRSSLDLYSNFSYFLNDPRQGDQFNQSERRTMGGANASLTQLNQIAGVDMRNKIGLQLRDDAIAPLGLYTTVARQRLATVREDRVRQASAAVYLENTSYWLPSVRSIAGLRYDADRFEVNSSRAGDSGTVAAHQASPKLSLIFGPWQRSEYFINYGTGFHSNDARGTTQTRLPDGSAATPVAPLVAARGAELGWRSEMAPGWQNSLSWWRLNIDSELVFNGDSGATTPSRPSQRHGIEWSSHYSVAEWLWLDLAAATSQARYRGSAAGGNFIPEALDRMASLGVTVRQIGRWSGAFDVRYVGPRPLLADDSVRSGSATLASGRLAYQLARNTRLTLDGFNLFNRQANDVEYYYPSRLAGEAAAGVSDVHFHPVEPRALRFTLSHNY